MIYYIIGYPCSGKSTFANKIGKYYNVEVIDLDEEISKIYGGNTINELFNILGEDKFREAEANVLHKISESKKNSDVIISTGGGCACYYRNITCMHKYGIIIYLKCSVNTIYKRLSEEEIEKRPRFLKEYKEGNLYEFIEEDYQDREYWYKYADIKINEESFNNQWSKFKSIRN